MSLEALLQVGTQLGFLGKLWIPGLGQEKKKQKQSLKHFVVPESEKVLKKWRGMSKGHKKQIKEAPRGQNQNKLSNTRHYNSNAL